jgi:hypothetical protein
VTRAQELWTAEEEGRLLAAFDAGATLGDLARAHERTPAAICSRLVRLNQLVYNSATGAYHKVELMPWGSP